MSHLIILVVLAFKYQIKHTLYLHTFTGYKQYIVERIGDHFCIHIYPRTFFTISLIISLKDSNLPKLELIRCPSTSLEPLITRWTSGFLPLLEYINRNRPKHNPFNIFELEILRLKFNNDLVQLTNYIF